jgi:hypothetical protein
MFYIICTCTMCTCTHTCTRRCTHTCTCTLIKENIQSAVMYKCIIFIVLCMWYLCTTWYGCSTFGMCVHPGTFSILHFLSLSLHRQPLSDQHHFLRPINATQLAHGQQTTGAQTHSVAPPNPRQSKTIGNAQYNCHWQSYHPTPNKSDQCSCFPETHRNG